jgi:signal transduction histidine kinase
MDALAAHVLRTLPDGVAVLEATGVVVAANPALEAALAAGPLAGRALGTLLRPVGDGTLTEAVRATLGTTGWRGELRRHDAPVEDGVWEVTMAPLGATSPPRDVVAVFRDVRDRHVRERERLDFLSMVTHDIKGPLTVILGYAELLSDPTETVSPAEMLETLGRIHESGQQIHALVSNFIELSRIEAGRQVVDRRPVDVPDVLDRLVAQQAARARRKGVAMELACDVVPPVPADRPQLERILNNLLGNALKYTPAGGHVSLRAAREDGAVTIAVADDGPGIAAEDLPIIFEKYRRAPAARRVEGVGLGLFIARTLARAHGGDVTVASTPGRGATFTLRLPLAD